MTTAYLLAFFRFDGKRTELMGTDISRHSAPTINGRIVLDVTSSTGDNYEDAVWNLRVRMAKEERFEWALRSLVQR